MNKRRMKQSKVLIVSDIGPCWAVGKSEVHFTTICFYFGVYLEASAIKCQ